MDIEEQTEDGITTLVIAGRITMQTAHQILNRLESVFDRARAVLICLNDVDYMDSSGVGVLVTALKRAKAKETPFGIAGINDRVKVVMEMSGLTKLFQIFPDQAAAVEAFRA